MGGKTPSEAAPSPSDAGKGPSEAGSASPDAGRASEVGQHTLSACSKASEAGSCVLSPRAALSPVRSRRRDELPCRPATSRPCVAAQGCAARHVCTTVRSHAVVFWGHCGLGTSEGATRWDLGWVWKPPFPNPVFRRELLTGICWQENASVLRYCRAAWPPLLKDTEVGLSCEVESPDYWTRIRMRREREESGMLRLGVGALRARQGTAHGHFRTMYVVALTE